MRQIGKYNITNDEYHGDKDYFSSSTIKEALESPCHFKYNILQKNKPALYNKNFELGTLVHTVLLEAHLFDEQYIVHDCATNKDGTIPVAELKKLPIDIRESGKTIVSKTWYQFAVKSRENTLKYTDAAKLLFSDTGESEPSYFTDCPETGLRLKVRPDRIDLTNKFIVDVKTSYTANKHEFTKIVKYDRHYDLSAYMYVKQVYEATGILCDYYWQVIGKEELCPVAVYKMSAAMMESGKAKFFKSCDNIKTALSMPDDVLYQNEIEEI